MPSRVVIDSNIRLLSLAIMRLTISQIAGKSGMCEALLFTVSREWAWRSLARGTSQPEEEPHNVT